MNTAASGLHALSHRLDVIANNLANVNTVGFKKARANFEDLLYQVRRQPGSENSLGDITPAGILLGTGVRLSSTQFCFEQGSFDQTGKQLDLAIDGAGLFQVRVFEDMGPNGIGYTRAGNFFRNANGEIVLGNSNGFRLEPPITISEDATSVTIGSDGRVLVTTPGATEPEEVGQIELARFVNPEGLLAKGQNVYVETQASGPPIVGVPTEEGFGAILQGSLEQSNVEPVRELVDLIQTQRSFELNGRSISAADEMLQAVVHMR